MTSRPTLLALAAALSCPALAQFGGGPGDGFHRTRTVAVDPSGAVRGAGAAYVGGRGDGADRRASSATDPGGALVATLFTGGRADGSDRLAVVSTDLAGEASLTALYAGSRGDGFDASALTASVLDGSAGLAALYRGGGGDGFDRTRRSGGDLAGGELAGVFAGGPGDGFDGRAVAASGIGGAATLAALYAGGAGDGFDRAAFSGAAPLPLTLLALEALAKGAVTVVQWSTADERGTDFFVVERSADADVFAELGEVDARGAATPHPRVTHYAYTDEDPLPGTSYYRLAIHDRDGTRELTALVAVAREMLAERAPWSFALFPNPSSGAELYAVPRGLVPAEAIGVEVVDDRGRTMYTATAAAGTPGEALRIGLERRLAPGTYAVRLTARGRSRTKVIVVVGEGGA